MLQSNAFLSTSALAKQSEVDFGNLAGKVPLFNAASELEQLSCIIHLLGTYDPSGWASPGQLPDFEKIRFNPSTGIALAQALPQASSAAVDLVSSCLRCGPNLPNTFDMSTASLYSARIAKRR